MQNQVAAIVLVVAIVVGAGLGYLGGIAGSVRSTELSRTTVTTTSTTTMTSLSAVLTTSIVTTTATVLGRPSGPYATMITKVSLRMELTLNSSKMPLGRTIQIVMNLTNVLKTGSHLSTESAWPVSGLFWPPNGGCYTFYYPIGMAIFAGYYVAGNLSLGRPLYIDDPRTHTCAELTNFSGYLFKPMSNNAFLTPKPTSIVVHLSTAINGSWVGHGPYFNDAKFSQFSPGTYTVIEGDEWGDILFLYFTVGP